MNKKLRFYVLLTALIFMLVGVVLAAPTDTNAPVTSASSVAVKPEASVDPIKMLEGVTSNVLRSLEANKNKTDLKTIYSLVDQYVLPYVDFNEMSLWVAGRTVWSKAPEKTKIEFMNAFKILVVRTYATALNSYTNEKIEFNKQKIDVHKERIQVKSLIIREGKNKENIHVDYRLIKRNGNWYVYDVIIEGVSILQGFQAQFSNTIRQQGLEKVTLQIVAHNKELNV